MIDKLSRNNNNLLGLTNNEIQSLRKSPSTAHTLRSNVASAHLWTSQLALKRLPCQRLVISSVSFSVGLPDTLTNIMSVFPFFVIFSMLSGLLGSTCEKSTGAEGLLCSGRSPSSMSSSFCQEGKSANHQKAAFKWQRQEYPHVTLSAGLGPTL